MKHLLDKKRVFVSDLSQALNVTEETIRRDLRNLELAGKVKRIRGGATLPTQLAQTQSPQHATDSTDSIVRQVRPLIRNGMSIMIAGSKLTLEVMSYLDKAINLTVITNSQELIERYAKRFSKVRFICTGGEYDIKRKCFYGPDAIRVINRHNVDLTLFSCDVFSNYPTYENELDAELVDAMLNQATQGVLLVANAQFDEHPAAVNGPNYRMFDTVLTEMAPPDDWYDLFDSRDIAVVFPEGAESEYEDAGVADAADADAADEYAADDADEAEDAEATELEADDADGAADAADATETEEPATEARTGRGRGKGARNKSKNTAASPTPPVIEQDSATEPADDDAEFAAETEAAAEALAGADETELDTEAEEPFETEEPSEVEYVEEYETEAEPEVEPEPEPEPDQPQSSTVISGTVISRS